MTRPPRLALPVTPQLRREIFGLVDGDSDGTVSYSDWRFTLLNKVPMADTNGDNRITLEELSRLDVGTIMANLLSF